MTAASVTVTIGGSSGGLQGRLGITPTPVGRIPAVESRPLSPTDFSSAVSALTSAFGDPTRRGIWLFAHEHDDGVTAAEVAQRFDPPPQRGPPPPRQADRRRVPRGHRRPGARRRCRTPLEALPRGGRPGRPRRPGPPRRPRHHAARSGPGPPAAGGRRGDGRGGRARVRPGDGPGDGRHRRRPALVPSGPPRRRRRPHRPRLRGARREAGNELRIVSRHCPFGDAAVEHPVICAVDRGMVKGMLAGLYGETEASIQSSLPMGDSVCITAVEA